VQLWVGAGAVEQAENARPPVAFVGRRLASVGVMTNLGRRHHEPPSEKTGPEALTALEALFTLYHYT
jgi:hypothetical protein